MPRDLVMALVIDDTPKADILSVVMAMAYVFLFTTCVSFVVFHCCDSMLMIFLILSPILHSM